MECYQWRVRHMQGEEAVRESFLLSHVYQRLAGSSQHMPRMHSIHASNTHTLGRAWCVCVHASARVRVRVRVCAVVLVSGMKLQVV